MEKIAGRLRGLWTIAEGLNRLPEYDAEAERRYRELRASRVRADLSRDGRRDTAPRTGGSRRRAALAGVA
jgi:hypothetical protein